MRLAMVAGEASGDLLASLLLGGLKARWPALAAAGIGGPRMVARGFHAWWPSDRLAVRGYVEVLRHYRALEAVRDALGERLLHDPPAAFVGIDAPDFNLGLERRLKAAGLKTIHFVCPSIWAWRGSRVKTLAASCDHVLCVFPFEPALLAGHGVRATYVGHPLADAIPRVPPKAAARAALGLAADDTVVAVLPGSRRSEIEACAPPFLGAVNELRRRRSGLRFLLPAAPGLRAAIDAQVAAHAPAAGIEPVEGRSHEVLAACDVAIVASGTATLEAALFKRPMTIGYRMNEFSWQLMKRMAYQPWVGLPNILARDFLVPERIQSQCTPGRLAADVLAWLDDAAGVDRLARRFDELHHTLARDTARAATDAIAETLEA
jgi:lipid-A-disaccharide synthase